MIIQMELPLSLNRTSSTNWRIKNRPRPTAISTLSGAVGSGTLLGSNPSPSSHTCTESLSGVTTTCTCTCLVGSKRLPYTMALASASHRATLSLNRAACGGIPLARQCRATRSTASSMIPRSVGTLSEICTARSDAPGGGSSLRRTLSLRGDVTSESCQCLFGGVVDCEQGVELGQLEERSQIFIEPGEA
jgi:hypothetical protein